MGFLTAVMALTLSKAPSVVNVTGEVEGGVISTEFEHGLFKPLPVLKVDKNVEDQYVHSSIRRVKLNSGSYGVRIVVVLKPVEMFI